MREIKFRAWDGKTMLSVLEIYDMDTGLKVLCEDAEGKRHAPNMKYTVLMQSTGLKAKNGVEIYEVDIVRRRSYPTGVVTFRKGAFVLDFNLPGELMRYQRLDSYGGGEVIGNIHENPELLNKEGDTK